MKFTSILFTALSTLFSGIKSISAQSQTLTPGTYQFASTVTDPSGNFLALTDQGFNQSIVLTPLNFGQPNQLWNVTASLTGPDAVQVIAPSSNNRNIFQVGLAGPPPAPLITVAQSVIWLSEFKHDNSFGFTFLDTVLGSTFWGVSNAIDGTAVNAVMASATPLNFWVPIRVS